MARHFDGSVEIMKLSRKKREDLDKFARAIRLSAPTMKERAKLFRISLYKMRLIEHGRYLGPVLFEVYVKFGAVPIPKWIVEKYFEKSKFKRRHKLKNVVFLN